MKINKKQIFVLALILIILCLVFPTSKARQLGGGWGCAENCAFDCGSVGNATEANCLASGGSSATCSAQNTSAKCMCISVRHCGMSCEEAEDCPAN